MKKMPLVWRMIRTVGAALMLSLVSLCAVPLPSAHAQWVHVASRCGRCGRDVPLSSHAGQRCPHCSAFWGSEVSRYGGGTTSVSASGTAGPPAPTPAPAKITVHHPGGSMSVAVRHRGSVVLVPVRTFEDLGATVSHTNNDGLLVRAGGRRVSFRPADGSYTAYNEGVVATRNWPARPEVLGATTYVPLRALAEALGYGVECDGEDVRITAAAGAGAEIVPDGPAAPAGTDAQIVPDGPAAPTAAGTGTEIVPDGPASPVPGAATPPAATQIQRWLSTLKASSVWPEYINALVAPHSPHHSPSPCR